MRQTTTEVFMCDWIKVADRLPDIGEQVVLITTDSYWYVPDGVPEANVTATGYRADCGAFEYWAIFGERGMDLNAFTHWMPLQNPTVDA
jgi:hypothetical protein